MAASPAFKVYAADGEYRAAVRYVEDAALLVAFLGEDATIRFGHAKRDTVWTEGRETQPAGESFDHVCDIVRARIVERGRRCRWADAERAAEHAVSGGKVRP